MNVLALETATDVCSVAVMRGDVVEVVLTLDRPRAHAENLVLMIQDALRYARVAAPAVDVVAVSKGPGSYTGLRIGASTAKGLVMALDASLVAVPSLDAMGAGVAGLAGEGDAICVARRARGTEVYVAAFGVDEAGSPVPLVGTVAMEAADVEGWLDVAGDACLWLVGDGIDVVASHLGDRHGAPVRLCADVRPSAEGIARLGAERFVEGLVEDAAAFEPFYLKEFVAKLPKQSIFERLSV